MDAVEQLETRVRALEDERAIADTLTKISDSFVQIDLEGWLDCFAPDASFTMQRGPDQTLVADLTGQAELEPWFVAHAERVPLGKSQQLLGQLRVQVDGDGAEATSLVALIHDVDNTPTLLAMVRFADTLVRSPDGKWRVKARRGVGQMRLANR
jgi:hypothetical protein